MFFFLSNQIKSNQINQKFYFHANIGPLQMKNKIFFSKTETVCRHDPLQSKHLLGGMPCIKKNGKYL